MEDETETRTPSEDDTPSEEETLSEEEEEVPESPPGWFRRHLAGFVVGVLASLVAFGVVAVGQRFFDHPPDKRVGGTY